MQVEVDPAHDEEYGDEEPEPDGLQLAPDDFVVLLLSAHGEQPHHDSGREGAQEDVQSQFEGKVDEQEHEQDRHPHGKLRTGVKVSLQEGHDLGRMGTGGEHGRDRRHHHEGQQQQAAHDRVLVRQEHGHQHDRTELTNGPDSEHVGAESRGEDPGVAEDGEQGAERRGGEGTDPR